MAKVLRDELGTGPSLDCLRDRQENHFDGDEPVFSRDYRCQELRYQRCWKGPVEKGAMKNR